jgi:hypothetical protein
MMLSAAAHFGEPHFFARIDLKKRPQYAHVPEIRPRR